MSSPLYPRKSYAVDGTPFIRINTFCLVVLEEHVSYNDSQSAYNPTTNVIRKIQNKERIGKEIAIRDRF